MDLEFEKKQAKALLKRFRSGDAAAVASMRAHLPRLAETPTPRWPTPVRACS
jgi:hypothetical protein